MKIKLFSWLFVFLQILGDAAFQCAPVVEHAHVAEVEDEEPVGFLAAYINHLRNFALLAAVGPTVAVANVGTAVELGVACKILLGILAEPLHGPFA